MSTKSLPRIGILGGMGPMAGVALQKLIINLTPAERDQDHRDVICFTHASIPDRATSLEEDGGRAYLSAFRESFRALERAGADVIGIPCNTAHARFKEFARTTDVPLVNIITETIESMALAVPRGSAVGILGTTSLINLNVYPNHDAEKRFSWMTPNDRAQQNIARMILDVKAGKTVDARELDEHIKLLASAGAAGVIIGCTELSLLYDAIAAPPVPVVDSLQSLCGALLAWRKR
ncbi:aspartate/glutamate racemase family protein [Candidatus Uhrbacteria bacterium]|nr:aspartate/glutamate racemase family protein [Candidatus Uhrbacteria bacterium]